MAMAIIGSYHLQTKQLSTPAVHPLLHSAELRISFFFCWALRVALGSSSVKTWSLGVKEGSQPGNFWEANGWQMKECKWYRVKVSWSCIGWSSVLIILYQDFCWFCDQVGLVFMVAAQMTDLRDPWCCSRTTARALGRRVLPCPSKLGFTWNGPSIIGGESVPGDVLVDRFLAWRKRNPSNDAQNQWKNPPSFALTFLVHPKNKYIYGCGPLAYNFHFLLESALTEPGAPKTNPKTSKNSYLKKQNLQLWYLNAPVFDSKPLTFHSSNGVRTRPPKPKPAKPKVSPPSEAMAYLHRIKNRWGCLRGPP